MESYRLLNRLGKGAQGAVYLAEHRNEGTFYVIKKIECKDEGEANASFKEAMVLRELDFPSICVYKEFFVMWDAEDSAINFCIVMDYYENGDLKTVIRMKQEKGEEVGEDLIKLWLGQIIGALVYINQHGIIHRDLKPSNIFLQGEGNVRIGDFGVATVMKDAQTHTRSVIGTSRYIAPETLEGDFSEKSDIWSLGVILVELMKCKCGENADMEWDEKLSAEEILIRLNVDGVPNTYSEDLLLIVKEMLEIDVSKRPTAEQLVNKNDYVRSCVDFVDCAKVDKQRRRNSAYLRRITPPAIEDATSLISFMKSIQCDEIQVQNTLASLKELLSKDDSINLSGVDKERLIEVMRSNVDEVLIMIDALDVLNHIVPNTGESDVLYSQDAISLIISLMKTHCNNPTFVHKACVFLSACSEQEECGVLIGELGGIQCIVSSLTEFITDAPLAAASCEVLWNLAVHEKNAAILTSTQGVTIIGETLRTHMYNASVVETATATLLSLAMEEDNLALIGQLSTVSLLMEAVNKHSTNAKIVKNAAFALASFSELHEESAFNVLKGVTGAEDKDVSGLCIINKAYECHKDNAEVVEALMNLIMEMSTYHEIQLELQYYKVSDILLAEVHKRFKENKDIIGPCEGAMKNLDIKINKKIQNKRHSVKSIKT